ncbi:MAG: hypothetical protein MK085_05105 [Phycisphaerales bacterium]|nr:hypothetical protein [Phycisphaerales bacterium]
MLKRRIQKTSCIDGSRNPGTAACVVCLSLGLAATNGLAEVLNVPGQYANIQAAIDAASDGDVIEIAAGTYLLEETDDFMVEGLAISIIGETNADGSPAVTIDGQFNGATTFQFFDTGKGQVVVRNLRIFNCLGGIAFRNSAGSVSNCVFEENYGYYGSVVFSNSQVTMNDCAVVGNQGGRAGGVGVSDFKDLPGSNISLVDCVIEGNTGSDSFIGVGGIDLYNGAITLDGCTVRGNFGSAIGGLYVSAQATAVLVDTTICGNQSVDGGEIPQVFGDWTDDGGNTIVEECSGDCPADFNGDGWINGVDLGLLFAFWDQPGGDLNGDGTTDAADLGRLLSSWGVCP